MLNKQLLKFLFHKKIIESVVNLTWFFYDEPKFFLYYCKENKEYPFYNRRVYDCSGGGIDDKDQETALLISIMETLERISSYTFQEKKIIYQSFNHLNVFSLDPNIYTKNVYLNSIQNKKINIDIRNNTMGWIEGYNFTQKKKGLLPAQLVYPNYIEYMTYEKDLNEPFLLGHNATTSAVGFDQNRTLIKAIYETIERDVMSIYFITNKIPKRIKLSQINDTHIRQIINKLRNYGLYPFIFDLENDFEIPVIKSMILDPTGKGPISSLGYGCSSNWVEAVKKSLLESFQVRIHFRLKSVFNIGNIVKRKLKNIKVDNVNFSGIYWTAPFTFKKSLFLMKHWPSESSIIKKNLVNKSQKNELERLTRLFKKKGYEIWYKDIAIEDINTFFKYYAYRVIIPGTQPQIDYEEPYKIFPNRIDQIII